MKRPIVLCATCGNEYGLTMKSVKIRTDPETGIKKEMTRCPYCWKWNDYVKPKRKK